MPEAHNGCLLNIFYSAEFVENILVGSMCAWPKSKPMNSLMDYLLFLLGQLSVPRFSKRMIVLFANDLK